MKKSLNTSNNAFQHKRQVQDSKKDAEILFKALYLKPISRRMAATKIGYPDQTFMVTQLIIRLVKNRKGASNRKNKMYPFRTFCSRVTTNPDLFISHNTNQLNLF
jgi:hypothetical protein